MRNGTLWESQNFCGAGAHTKREHILLTMYSIENAITHSIENTITPSIENVIMRSIENAISRSIENAISCSIEHVITRSLENVITCSFENLWFAQRLRCYSMLTKFFEDLLKKVYRFSSFLKQLHQIVELN